LLDSAAMLAAGSKPLAGGRERLSSLATFLRKERALAGILLLGSLLRLFYLQYGQYGSDDERLWAQALRSIAAHTLPASGIRSSIGANNGPFQVYLVMPAAALFGQAPLAGAIVVALLNAAAVYFLYRLVAEPFGRRPALIAALLFAVNSWAIIYARRMQGQDMLVPFQVLFFWSAARWLARGKGRDLLLMFLWLAILTQVYILGLLHLATAGVVLALGWRHLLPPRKGQWAVLAGGAALWAGLSAPYFFSALLPALSSFGNVSGSHPHLDLASIVLALTMASHKGFQTIAGQAGGVFDSTGGFEGWLVAAEEALFAAGFLYVVVRLIFPSPTVVGEGQSEGTWRRRDEDPRVLALLLVWALIPVALFARHSVDLYPYYFVAIVPLPAVFTALLLDAVWTRGGAIALGVLTANALALAGVFFYVLPGYWTKNDYGLPYRYTFDTVPQVERMVAGRGLGRVYVDGDMDPSEVMSSVLARAGLSVLWFDDYRTPEFAAPPAGGSPALYLTMADDTDTAHFLRDTFASRQVLAFPLPGEGITIRGYEIAPPDVRRALDRLLTEKLDLKVANGVNLDSFHGDRRLQPGNTLRAALSWTWPGGTRPDELRYAIFAHLVDGSGKVVAETDNPLLPSVDWRAGEQVVQWLDLPLPVGVTPGRYVLDIGIYAQDGVIRQDLTAAGGKSIGSSFTRGPFVVPPPQAPPTNSVEAQLGDGIQLLAHAAASSAGHLRVDLTWGATARPSRDYTVFVHLLDASGKLVAQADSQPRGGDFPTSVWQPGDRIADSYSLQAPPGRYTVEVGMYDLPTLQRLGEPLRFYVEVSQ